MKRPLVGMLLLAACALPARAIQVEVKFSGMQLTRWVDGLPELVIDAEEGGFWTANETLELLGIHLNFVGTEGERRLETPRARWDLNRNVLRIDGTIEGYVFQTDGPRTEKVRFNTPQAEYEVGARELRSDGPVEFFIEYGGPKTGIRSMKGRLGRVAWRPDLNRLHVEDGLELDVVWPNAKLP